ncbi:MAG TPA: hypothetical protein VE969_05725 [Pyrinomonadaceae bacterium]|nr:hypothetical protein [Pyrinomonadaceae bacterium]
MQATNQRVVHSLAVLTVFIFTIVSVISFSSRRSSATISPAAQPRNSAVVFAISSEGDEGSMDAVVIVNGARLQRPYNDEIEGARKTFGQKYFAAGKVYRLIFGGGEAGTVKVNSWDLGCNNIHAKVTANASARLGGKVMALATTSETLGKRQSTRRAPSETERAGVLTLMKSIYRQNRTPANLMSLIKVTNLTATDVDGDGTYEMIGSFTLAAKNKFERDLFLIAKPQGLAMKADLVKFQAYQPPPEEFLSSIDFVDQLDLDGNGVGEVFATQGGFDGYGYLIFKKVGGRWREVFNFVGDAC